MWLVDALHQSANGLPTRSIDQARKFIQRTLVTIVLVLINGAKEDSSFAYFF
jgi:hypothetical protein